MKKRQEAYSHIPTCLSERNTMAVDTVYENQDTVSPRLNKQ